MFVAINYKKEMKKELFIACSLCGTMLVNAENIEVTTFKYAGPYALVQPYQVDIIRLTVWMLIPSRGKRSHCWIRRCHFLCLKEQK